MRSPAPLPPPCKPGVEQLLCGVHKWLTLAACLPHACPPLQPHSKPNPSLKFNPFEIQTCRYFQVDEKSRSVSFTQTGTHLLFLYLREWPGPGPCWVLFCGTLRGGRRACTGDGSAWCGSRHAPRCLAVQHAASGARRATHTARTYAVRLVKVRPLLPPAPPPPRALTCPLCPCLPARPRLLWFTPAPNVPYAPPPARLAPRAPCAVRPVRPCLKLTRASSSRTPTRACTACGRRTCRGGG